MSEGLQSIAVLPGASDTQSTSCAHEVATQLHHFSTLLIVLFAALMPAGHWQAKDCNRNELALSYVSCTQQIRRYLEIVFAPQLGFKTMSLIRFLEPVWLLFLTVQ
ncbi:unnamed protein product [Polarella glacialis]|uniref:Uncharacterized protein n=1 Tax=Polarella glacialis TaxID=89957 RepID=A0A813EQV5_POLGL|nr:unnamed protein product [Polarella glacialis]